MIKFSKRLLFIIIKNLKIVFRSWTSILLLILGPMILILILGFAFQGDELHDIRMGVYAKDYGMVDPLLKELQSPEVEIMKFRSQGACILAMNHSLTHLCVEFTPDFEYDLAKGEAGEGLIIFHYDNSRYNLIKFILDYMEERISITSEAITLEATQAIFSDVADFVLKMQAAQENMTYIKQEVQRMRLDLLQLRVQLEETQNDFQPKYEKIKYYQTQIHDNQENLQDFIDANEDLMDIVDELELVNEGLDNLTGFLEINLYVIPALTPVFNESLTQINNVQGTINKTIEAIYETGSVANLTAEQTMEMLNEIDSIVAELDAVSELLNDSIAFIDATLPKLDMAVDEINKAADEIDEAIEQFSQFDEEKAEQLVHPIKSEFSPVLGDLPKIHLIFPILLVFVITFIAILLSNMVVLNETHSPAYFRNFLLPINNLAFILGLYITNIIVIAIQVFVLLLVAYMNFHIDVFSIFPQLAFAIFLVTTVFVFTGMIIGYLIRARQSSIIICTFLALAIFLFSDVIFPVEIMPPLAAFFANLNPLLVGENLFRKIIFFHISYGDLTWELMVLCSFIVVLAGITVAAYYKNKARR